MAKIPVAPVGGNGAVWGTYRGDGKATRKIDLGFTPRFLSVWSHSGRQGRIGGSSGSTWDEFEGGACTTEYPALVGALKIVDGGFSIANNPEYGYFTNTNNLSYIYLAFR